MRFNYLSAGLLGSVSLVAMASAASAQTEPVPPTAQEIVVTGSRVIANGNNSPTPVTVVSDAQLMELQPSTINDALNNLPVFQGSRGQFSTPSTNNIYGAGDPAATELNLRNLGSQRTLILFDGQRVAPTTNLGIVDVDMIPQELIQRVDIVTGGASAVYGSDAIAGVVNYVLDHNFNGFKMDANYGVSSFGDAQSWKIGLAAGTKLFDGKGHIEGSYNHYDNNGLPHRSDREYADYALLGSVPGGTPGTAGDPYALFNNVTSTLNSWGGLISNGALKGQQFASNGVLSTFNPGAATGTSGSNIAGQGSYAGYASLEAPVTFDQLFLRFDYDLTDTIRFHTDIAANRKTDITYAEPSAFNNQTYSTSNAFLMPAQQALLNSTGSTATFTMSKDYSEIPGIEQVSNVQDVFINTGFDGKLGKYSWNLNYNYSDNIIHDAFENNINSQKLSAALDAVVNPATGQVVCNASLTNSAYANCVPFNAFGPTAASQAAINYVTETDHLKPHFIQNDVSGSISGEVFSLPAGPVDLALSADWRRQVFTQSTDAPAADYVTCTGGIRYNCGATTPVYQISFASTAAPVEQTVAEGAIETDIPILKDLPLIQSFSLNGALRYTAYDFGGKGWTYKVGLDWHVNDDVRIRGTVSQDIEAPALDYLFRPLVTSYAAPTDYLTNVTYTNQVPTYNIGNPNLVAEVGHTETLGVVWRPHFIPGFSFSVDAYHIIVDGALVQIIGQAQATQEACYVSGGTSSLCALQTRALGSYTNTSPANVLTSFTSLFENASSFETYGADFELNYGATVFDRAFNSRVLMSWQPHFLYSQPGAATVDFGNVAFPTLIPFQAVPAVQLTAMLNYQVTSKLTIGLVERWRPALQLEPSGTVGVFPSGPPAFYTTDLNLSYQIGKSDNEIYFNIQNLLDMMPVPSVGLSSSANYTGVDSPIGRYFTVGFRTRF